MEERKSGLVRLIIVYSFLFVFCMYKNLAGILMSVFILLIPFLFGFFLKRYGITRVKGHGSTRAC